MNIDLDVKISIVATLMVALGIMTTIRLSGYVLPKDYYFAVSNVFQTGDSSFLEGGSAGISSSRICSIINKSGLLADEVGFAEGCSIDIAGAADADSVWTDEHIQNFTALWRTRRPAIEARIDQVLSKSLGLAAALDEDIEQPPYGGSANRLIAEESLKLSAAVWMKVYPVIEEEVDSWLLKTNERVEESQETEEDAQQLLGRSHDLNAEDLRDLRLKIARDLPKTLGRTFVSAELTHPNNEAAAEIVRNAGSADNLSSGLASYYAAQFRSRSHDFVQKSLADAGFPVREIAAAQSRFKGRLILSNLPTYTVAAFLRFTIVFAVVFGISCLLLGRYDMRSFAIGGAVAGILLTWPVVSLWDVVVTDNFKPMRWWFLGIYAIYITAFYFTAKAATLGAVRLRQSNGRFVQAASVAANGVNVSARELVGNLFVAISLNAFTFGGKLLLSGA